MFTFKRKHKDTVNETPATDVVKALDEVKDQLLAMEVDAFTRDQSLAFAQSLLTAVGENPETPQNQLLVHQMAIENLRARMALVNAAAARK
jgi:hypothetical protein